MAGSLKGPDLGKRLVKFARTIEGASLDTLKSSADKAKAEQLKVMRSDSGGDLKLSGVGRRRGRPGGAKVGVNYKLTKGNGSPSALVSATGPLPLIANKTKAHAIGSAFKPGRASQSGLIGLGLGRSASASGGRKAVLHIPGVGFRRSARHPGTKGKDTWNRGRKKAEPVIRKQMSRRTTAAIKKGMSA